MFEWFSFNNLKAIASKCQLFISPYKPGLNLINLFINLRCSIIESSNCNKLLGISKDSKFSFNYHINRICHKPSQKLHALSRIAKYISEEN